MKQRAPPEARRSTQPSRASGVRWAESTFDSKGTEKSASCLAASFITSQSLALPITMPTKGELLAIFLGSQLLSGQALKGLAILLGGLRDHVGGKARRGRRLVPVERLQVVAHVLLVVRRRARPRLVFIDRPEARRIGGQRFIDQHELAAGVGSKLELG